MARPWGMVVYGLYRAASRAASPLLYLHVHWRRLRGLEHASRWPERFGRPSSPRPPGPLLWFHAVSLGEGLAAIPVIRHCVRQNPNFVVLMTTTTTSAFEVIKDQLPNDVIYQFAPLDTPAAVDAFLLYWNPIAILLMESELWPNLIISAARKGIAVALLNARMSCKSFRRWSKTVALPLISLMLSKLSLVASLSTTEAIRYQLLHASPWIINFAGDLKYVMLWVHRELLKVYPDLVTILVTRHPRHGQTLGLALKQQGLAVALRSRDEVVSPSTSLFVVDTLGELRMLYRVTPIAVIGGSFLPGLAGHNVSEAAAAGCAVLTGPYVGHFSRMLSEMRQLDSLSVLQVKGKEELVEAVRQLLGSKDLLGAHQKAAKQVFSTVSDGIVDRVWDLVNANVLKDKLHLSNTN